MIYSNFINTVELFIWLTKKREENILNGFRIKVVFFAKGQKLRLIFLIQISYGLWGEFKKRRKNNGGRMALASGVYKIGYNQKYSNSNFTKRLGRGSI